MIHEHQLRAFRDTVGSAFAAGMPNFPHYTLHGQEHLEELDRLCLLFGGAIPKLTQNQDKLNILRLAIIIHDYAMVDVPSRSRESELRARMDPDLSFADVVRMTHQDEIAQSLRQKSQSLYDTFSSATLHEINDAIEIARYHRFHPIQDAPEHLRDLCSLMRLLDELDIGSKRAPLAVYNSLRDRMDDNSRFHWLKHICCASIETNRTFFHEVVNGRHKLHLWVAVQATEASWQPLQTRILRKLHNCLVGEGIGPLIREALGIDVVIDARPEEPSLCGAARVLPPDVKEDLNALAEQWAQDAPGPCEKQSEEPAVGEAEVADDQCDFKETGEVASYAIPALSERQLIIHAVPAEDVFQHLCRAGRLSVIGNEYVPRKEQNVGGVPGAPNRVYLGPADCGKTRAAAQWINEIVGSHPANWVVLRTDQGDIPEKVDDNIILDKSCFAGGLEIPQNAVLFLDDLPGNLPLGGARDDAADAIRRLLRWFRQQPYFRERRLVGTIRCEELYHRPGWPEVLPTLGTELELIRLLELTEMEYSQLWNGMNHGTVFLSHEKGERDFSLTLDSGFVEDVAKRSTNPEGIAQFVFDAARRNQDELAAADAADFRASAVQTWLTETWPALRDAYGIPARVFHTLARFLEGGLRPNSGFKGSVPPLWEFHAAFGPGICANTGGDGADYLEKLNQIGRDGHAVGRRGEWIRPRWDFLLQSHDLPSVEVDLPDSTWFASRSGQLPSELRQMLAAHMTAAEWNVADAIAEDDDWLVGIGAGKHILADAASDEETRQQLLEEEIDNYRRAIAINESNDTAWTNLGGLLGRLADAASDKELRQRLLKESVDSYRRVIAINESDDTAWANLGGSLGKQADAASDEELRQRLLKESVDSLRRAIAINESDDTAWTNLGVALGKQADAASDEELRQRLLKESVDSLRRAIAINESDDTAWTNLGVALGKQADAASDEELRQRLRKESIDSYRRAIAINESNDTAWTNLGVALGKQADAASDEELRQRLRKESIDSYRRAIAINESDDTAWANLGGSLGKQADAASDEELRQRLLKESVDSYRRAIAINESNDTAWTNLGVALGKQADAASDEELRQRLRKESVDSYRRAIAINESDDTAWTNLGVALGKQADAASDEELRQRLRKESVDSYRRAIAINESDDTAWTNLGVALGKQADAASDEELRQRFLKESVDSYRRAIAINESNDTAWTNLGVALGKQADAASDEELRQRLLKESVDSLRRAIAGDTSDSIYWGNLAAGLVHVWRSSARNGSLDEAHQVAQRESDLGGGRYNLACVLALEEQVDEAFAELADCLERGEIAWSHVEGDPDWTVLRKDQRYRQLQRQYSGDEPRIGEGAASR